MKIDIFTDYRVSYTFNHTYLDDEGKLKKGVEHYTRILDGKTLLGLIAKIVLSDETISFTSNDFEVKIEQFLPHFGQFQNYKIIYIKKD